MATTPDDRLAAVFGTMGGDAQPQILLQLAARLLAAGESPATAVHAARWVLHPDSSTSNGFDTWTSPNGRIVAVEDHAPGGWATGLEERGHRVRVQPGLDGGFGHAHAITIDAEGLRRAAADPRTFVGSAAAL
jgi:gamma-glutamyltranspeptidase/glutathione hydrolase